MIPDHNGLELLTAANVERIYEVTDALRLHRDWVIVPLACAEAAFESVLPDGKVLLRPPRRNHFERWLEGLPKRLPELGLSRTARLGTDDPVKHLSGSFGPHPAGSQGYLGERSGLLIGRSGPFAPGAGSAPSVAADGKED
jgi:hypothetical protein